MSRPPLLREGGDFSPSHELRRTSPENGQSPRLKQLVEGGEIRVHDRFQSCKVLVQFGRDLSKERKGLYNGSNVTGNVALKSGQPVVELERKDQHLIILTGVTWLVEFQQNGLQRRSEFFA